MPQIESLQAQKLQKLHPLVLSLITPVGYEDHWQTQIAKLMKNGNSDNTNISVYDLLCCYQREREHFVELDMALLWNRIEDDQPNPLDFYLPSDIYLSRLDKNREMQLETLATCITRDLKHHRMHAEERQWTAYQDSQKDWDDKLYPDGVMKALQYLDSFHLVQFWPRLTEQCNNELNMFQCFCQWCRRYGVCHHAWAIQIIMGLNKSSILLMSSQDLRPTFKRIFQDVRARKTNWLGIRNRLKKSNRKRRNGKISV